MKILTLAFLALGAIGCQKPSTEARLLEVKATPGATYRFDISTQMKASGADGEAGFAGTIDEKLLSIQGDEQVWEMKFDVTNTTDSGVMKGAAASFQQMDGIVMKRHSDPTGQVHKMVIGEISVPNSGTPDLVYSKKPVKIGDTWTTTVKSQNLSVEVEYKLEDYGKFEGVDAAKITGSYKPGQTVENIEPLVFWVDLKDGKTLSSVGSLKLKQPGATIDMRFELKRKKA